MKRLFSQFQRKVLFALSNGRCANCDKPLSGLWHADHKQPFSAGGPTIINNGQALCQRCNLAKGNKNNVFSNKERAVRLVQRLTHNNSAGAKLFAQNLASQLEGDENEN